MEEKVNFIYGFLKLSLLTTLIVSGIFYTAQKISEKSPLKHSVTVSQVEKKKKEVKKATVPPARKRSTKKALPSLSKKKKETPKAVEKRDEIKKDLKLVEAKKPVLLSIRKLKVIQLPEDKVIRLTFILRNRTKNMRVKGKIFIKFYKGNNHFIFPATELKEDKPVEIKKGINYSIKKYRRVEIIIENGVDLKKFNRIQFLIFEDTGILTLAYDKSFKLRIESGDIFKNPF